MKKNIYLIIDFDSTIISCETLDELSNIILQDNPKKASSSDITKLITEITNNAMAGKIEFSKALNERLEILSINEQNITDTIRLIKTKISDTFIQNIEFIKKNTNNIYIVSGGFIEFINPVAQILGIKPNHIFCNSFIKNKYYYKLNKKNIMARSNGKSKVVKQLNLNGTVVVIGDGYTDYEIKKHGNADIFIAYTEHVNRKKVSALANYQSNSFNDIIDYLNNL